jgi:hypothetical protein
VGTAIRSRTFDAGPLLAGVPEVPVLGRTNDDEALSRRAPEPRPAHGREPEPHHGLGRLLDLEGPAGAPPAASDATSADLVLRRASLARARGDRWFSCVLREPVSPSDDPSTPRSGSVVTAVEDAGWRLRRLDHLWLGDGQAAIAVCCTFSAVPATAPGPALEGLH